MRALPAAACLLGILASLAPWAAHTLDLWPHRQHSDLWIALGVFVVAAAAPSVLASRATRIAHGLLGLAAVGIAAVNLPDVVERTAHAGEPGVAGFLGEAAVGWSIAYGVVALAGLLLVASAVLTSRVTQA